MNPKPQPNHQQYLQALQDLGPEGRFKKMLELTQRSKNLFLHGLRKRFPEKTEEEISELYLEKLKLKSQEELGISQRGRSI